MAGWDSVARRISAKRPNPGGRIASRSYLPPKLGSLSAATQKWLDQNHASRSAKPISAPSAAAKRALASPRKISRTTFGSSGLAPAGSVVASAGAGAMASVLPMARLRSSASRWAITRRARRSARNSNAARTACALVIRWLPSIRPIPGRSSSASKAPRGSEASAAIEPRRGPRPKRCSASAADCGSSDMSGLARVSAHQGSAQQYACVGLPTAYLTPVSGAKSWRLDRDLLQKVLDPDLQRQRRVLNGLGCGEHGAGRLAGFRHGARHLIEHGSDNLCALGGFDDVVGNLARDRALLSHRR